MTRTITVTEPGVVPGVFTVEVIEYNGAVRIRDAGGDFLNLSGQGVFDYRRFGGALLVDPVFMSLGPFVVRLEVAPRMTGAPARDTGFLRNHPVPTSSAAVPLTINFDLSSLLTGAGNLSATPTGYPELTGQVFILAINTVAFTASAVTVGGVSPTDYGGNNYIAAEDTTTFKRWMVFEGVTGANPAISVTDGNNYTLVHCGLFQVVGLSVASALEAQATANPTTNNATLSVTMGSQEGATLVFGSRVDQFLNGQGNGTATANTGIFGSWVSTSTSGRLITANRTDASTSPNRSLGAIRLAVA
jgi:hypothetical protein